MTIRVAVNLAVLGLTGSYTVRNFDIFIDVVGTRIAFSRHPPRRPFCTALSTQEHQYGQTSLIQVRSRYSGLPTKA